MPSSFRRIPRGRVAAAVAILLLAALPHPATAGVPSAANSTLPACLSASPDGAFSGSVTVRDIA
ncbi:MAG TPA: hypothetical protein VLV15_08760, partial [Dongiaceae bacterium]|nr:hypothetical protein [Dongiaceae bacterium]